MENLIQQKINYRIQNFAQLPDDALLSSNEISMLSGRSRSSIWRDVNSQRLPKPIVLGLNSVRWTVKDIKSYLNGKIV
jgi:predicted DNA-binding transcriptional regulator AlpA